MGYIVMWARGRDLAYCAVWVSNLTKALTLKGDLQEREAVDITITEVNDQNGEPIES